MAESDLDFRGNRILADEFVGEQSPAAIQVPSIETAGGTTIPAGTLTEVLQAIADLADPAI